MKSKKYLYIYIFLVKEKAEKVVDLMDRSLGFWDRVPIFDFWTGVAVFLKDQRQTPVAFFMTVSHPIMILYYIIIWICQSGLSNK